MIYILVIEATPLPPIKMTVASISGYSVLAG